MKNDIRKFVVECEVCKKNKVQALFPAGLLQPLPIPQQIWEDLTTDFIEGLPKSQGFSAILIVVDKLTKYVHFIPLKHPFLASTMVALFVKVVRLYGIPRSIVSDRDKIFLCHFWKELFCLQVSQLRQSTTYHSQTDGQIEVVSRCLETHLRCFSSEKPATWGDTTYHSSMGTTPFKAVYGRDAPSLLRYEPNSTMNATVELLLQARDMILNTLKFHLIRAQEQMKIIADKNRYEHFEVGDTVYLK